MNSSVPRVRPAGYASVVPFLYSPDVERAIGFHEAVFGMRRTNLNVQDGKIVHAELEAAGEVVLMVAPDGIHDAASRSPASRGAVSPGEILVYVADAAHAHDAAVRLGGKSQGAPENVPWGERHAHVQDPDGYRWLIAQNLNG